MNTTGRKKSCKGSGKNQKPTTVQQTSLNSKFHSQGISLIMNQCQRFMGFRGLKTIDSHVQTILFNTSSSENLY